MELRGEKNYKQAVLKLSKEYMSVVLSEFFGLTGKVESSLAHFPFMCNINGNNLLASIPLPIGLASHPPAHGQPTFPKSPSLAYLPLVFVTGWCGARLHSPDGPVTLGRGGGILRVIPSPLWSWAHPHSFPGWAPFVTTHF